MEKMKMHTPDLTQDNIAKLAALFPNCVTEARDAQGKLKKAVDFDQLRQELSGSIVEGPQERYRLDWPGKREALLAANAPIAKTLRPCREESVDFDTTKNLFIEGDNLEALKLLQETYLGKVKLIYIDPPYNTRSDLIYNDDFAVDSEAFLSKSNQTDTESNRLVLNTDSNGRFHSFWLSMIFPRLKLARNLLTEDGVILISIDDNEYENARKICGEIFGDANFIANMVWEKGRKNDAKLISVGHEYILIFAKSLSVLREQKTIWREEKPGARDIWEQYSQLRKIYGKNDVPIEDGLQRWYSGLPKNHPAKKWSRYKRVDENGPWRDRDISWPGGGGPRYDVLHPRTGKPCKVPERGWIYSTQEEMQRQITAGLVEFREDHTEPPFRKAHIRPIPIELESEVEDEEGADSSEEEFATQVRGSYFYKQSQVSVKFLRNLLGGKAFDNPKDHFELGRLIGYITANTKEAIIVDFFAGSGSTGHAVFESNFVDGGSRRFVLVQIPQVLDLENKSKNAAAKYCDQIGKPRILSEITKERLRRAGQLVLDSARKVEISNDLLAMGQNTSEISKHDLGFRVLKIDTSNMEPVFYSPNDVKQGSLFTHTDNIRPGRTSEDLLFQVLLDWGVDLALPIQRETLAGKEVFFVDETALAACFEGGIDEEFVKALAKRKPLRVVFRDAGFADDAVKINVGQIFKTLSPDTEVKVI